MDAKRHRRDPRDERGVAMVEFALVIPVLLLVMAGLFEFGRAFTYWLDANHLANEGARWAVVDRLPPGATSTQGFVYSQAATADMQVGMSVCVRYDEGKPGGTQDNAEIGDPVTIAVRRGFSFIPLLDQPAITITGKSTMRLERIADLAINNPITGPADDIGTCP